MPGRHGALPKLADALAMDVDELETALIAYRGKLAVRVKEKVAAASS